MIAVSELRKTIGAQEILRGIDLEVQRGETLAIIGRSGGGKSVLLKHIIGLMQPDSGRIEIDGQEIIGLTERQLGAIRQKVGILFQGAALFDSMTVAENVAFPLREAGERDPEILRERVREMLDVVELEGQEDKMPVSLSGGMKKRVGLARSIIRRPSCVSVRRADLWSGPGCFGQHQSPYHATAGAVRHDQHRRDARYEERVSGRESHCLPARRANLFSRNIRGASANDGSNLAGFPSRPFRKSAQSVIPPGTCGLRRRRISGCEEMRMQLRLRRGERRLSPHGIAEPRSGS